MTDWSKVPRFSASLLPCHDPGWRIGLEGFHALRYNTTWGLLSTRQGSVLDPWQHWYFIYITALMAAQSEQHLLNKYAHSQNTTGKQTPTLTWRLWACFFFLLFLKKWLMEWRQRETNKTFLKLETSCFLARPSFPCSTFTLTLGHLSHLHSFISQEKVVLYPDKGCTTSRAQSPPFCWIILLLWPQGGLGLIGLSPLKEPRFLSWGTPTPRDVKRSHKRLSGDWLLGVGLSSSVLKPKNNPVSVFEQLSCSWKFKVTTLAVYHIREFWLKGSMFISLWFTLASVTVLTFYFLSYYLWKSSTVCLVDGFTSSFNSPC